MATRFEAPFYDDFYSILIKKLNLTRSIDTKLPNGVTAHVRTDGEQEYVFVMH